MPKVKARRGVRDLNLGGLSVEAEGPRGSLHRRWRNPEDLRVAIGWLGTLGTKGRLMRTGRAEGKLEGWGGRMPLYPPICHPCNIGVSWGNFFFSSSSLYDSIDSNYRWYHHTYSQVTMSRRSSPFNLETCARPNILKLKPYRCAREYEWLALPLTRTFGYD